MGVFGKKVKEAEAAKKEQEEMKELLQTVSQRVFEASGIRLEPEIRIW